MDNELKMLLKITRNLPQIKGSGVLGNILLTFYNRKKRMPVIADTLNFRMKLDPGECVDGGILFHPQLYDFKGVRFFKSHLKKEIFF
jgi:hypothetical protein